ncbi:hypothetical protein JL722_15017 [Aureococcus anophagefferens]|nr:hypothetical protein JL722_15017 [Aureococcus anophagefferens]
MARRDAYVVAGAVIAVLCISSLRLSTSRSRAAPPPVAHAAALTELGLVAERLATTAARQESTLASLASSASATRSAVAAFERGDRAAAVFNSKMAADAPAAELAARRAREAGEGPGATTWILNALGGRNDDAMAALKKRAPLAWTEGEGMASYPRAPAPRLVSSRPSVASQELVGGCASEVAILALGAGALAAQVDALPPPPLALCDHFAFEDLAKGDAAALARLGPFLGLDDAGALARRVKAPHTPSAPGPKDAKGQRDRATLVAQLAAAQDSAVAACARQRRRA